MPPHFRIIAFLETERVLRSDLWGAAPDSPQPSGTPLLLYKSTISFLPYPTDAAPGNTPPDFLRGPNM